MQQSLESPSNRAALTCPLQTGEPGEIRAHFGNLSVVAEDPSMCFRSCFSHHSNQTVDSICRVCFETVVSHVREPYLERYETEHVCDSKVLKRLRREEIKTVTAMIPTFTRAVVSLTSCRAAFFSNRELMRLSTMRRRYTCCEILRPHCASALYQGRRCLIAVTYYKHPCSRYPFPSKQVT